MRDRDRQAQLCGEEIGNRKNGDLRAVADESPRLLVPSRHIGAPPPSRVGRRRTPFPSPAGRGTREPRIRHRSPLAAGRPTDLASADVMRSRPFTNDALIDGIRPPPGTSTPLREGIQRTSDEFYRMWPPPHRDRVGRDPAPNYPEGDYGRPDRSDDLAAIHPRHGSRPGVRRCAGNDHRVRGVRVPSLRACLPCHKEGPRRGRGPSAFRVPPLPQG